MDRSDAPVKAEFFLCVSIISSRCVTLGLGDEFPPSFRVFCGYLLRQRMVRAIAMNFAPNNVSSGS